MPHNDDEIGHEEKPSERRRREKLERDPNKPRKHRPKVLDPETGEYVKSPHRRRKEKDTDSELNKNMAEVVPELARTISSPGATSRSTIPYPTFSKAHSKEAVNSKDDISTTTAPLPMPKANHPYTPEATNLSSSEKMRTTSKENLATTTQPQTDQTRPPSPPDTIFSDLKNAKPIHSPRRTSQIKEESPERPRTTSQGSIRSKSWFSRSKEKGEVLEESRASPKPDRPSSRSSKPKSRAHAAVVEDGASETSEEAPSAIDSDVTSRAPPFDRSTKPKMKPPGLDADDSPDSHQESSPRTPTLPDPGFPSHNFRPSPASYMNYDGGKQATHDSPMPPPPPPPPVVPLEIPRVDYLLQNGGLARPVPRTLMAVTPAYSNQVFPRMNTPAPPEVEKVFGPFYSLLDQYETVISRNGSVAVATGYRSVARRLLDRLENVFARELPSNGCLCVMCRGDDRRYEKAPGWGDVLEAASGRREIPTWPALNFSDVGQDGSGLGISGQQFGPPRPGSPVKIDPDIAEEFHQHYLRQSKKTKASVDKWLSSTPGDVPAPPPDVDDETLTFTILTHLDPSERSTFNAISADSQTPVVPVSRAPTPQGRPRTNLIVRATLAIQRLYRLPMQPRVPEVCVYLVRNPDFHNMIVSLSEINNAEWEILISGRFDGFLWSGAEGDFPISASILNSPRSAQAPSRGPTPSNLPFRGSTPANRQPVYSRMGTPSAPSRGPTPNPYGSPASTYGASRQPVSKDEEAEIAILAELEREIYVGMEALEDAFEGLHRKAEVVRKALRDRGAGLSLSAQRRAQTSEGVYARLNTPGLGERGWGDDGMSEVDVESDWGQDDVQSEIAPDDSASNISSSRHRRPKRRVERRTPAPVEEEDEEE